MILHRQEGGVQCSVERVQSVCDQSCGHPHHRPRHQPQDLHVRQHRGLRCHDQGRGQEVLTNQNTVLVRTDQSENTIPGSPPPASCAWASAWAATW